MEEALVGLEANPDDDQLLEAIFRGAHTLKGNSASFGYPKVAGFAHALEDLLQRLRDRSLPVTSELIALLLRAVDAMRQMVPEAVGGADGLQADQARLLGQLATTPRLTASAGNSATGATRTAPARWAGAEST